MNAARTLDQRGRSQARRRARPLVELDPWVIAAALATAALLALALLGQRLAPHEPIYFVVEHGEDLRPYDPGVVFPLGSDVLGRDILSLVLAGAGATLAIGLTGGLARVAAGVLLAALGSLWRPARIVTEAAAELVSSIPATIVALIAVKILVKADTTLLIFVGALLIIGWAGPYRVVRAEIDRLAHAPFTAGARVLGVSSWRLFWRHQLPHLIPILSINFAQQVIASLVLVAELGVLGTFVGTTRIISIEESLNRVVVGPPNVAQIADPPEWGGLLAGARTVEILWTTRWLIFVPGVGFALAAIAIAVVAYSLSRRYSRHDIVDDVRGPGSALLAAGIVLMVITSTLLPERYAEARTWAADARAAVGTSAQNDIEGAFRDGGLAPLGAGYTLERKTTGVLQTAGATVSVGDQTVSEPWPRDATRATYDGNVRSFVSAANGGGVVQATVVFAGRGIVPPDPSLPVFRPRIGLQSPDLASLLRNYPDDYAGIDVRGKVVVLLRFYGFRHDNLDANGRIKDRQTIVSGGPDEAIGVAISRGAAAVVFVDPDLPSYADASTANEFQTTPSPYTRAESLDPPTTSGGVPVVIVSGMIGAQLLSPFGITIGGLLRIDDFGQYDGTRSVSRDLGVTARVAVPLENKETRSASVVAEVPGASADASHVLVWTVLPAGSSSSPSTAALMGLAHALAPRKVPLVFVALDPSGDARANRKVIVDALGTRRVGLVLILSDLTGDALEFITLNGDLIPAFDLYADKAGARHSLTRATSRGEALGNTAPLPGVRTVLIRGHGRDGDLRGDAAALIGYVAGRYALGAEELPR